jgi:hypothetical protein
MGEKVVVFTYNESLGRYNAGNNIKTLGTNSAGVGGIVAVSDTQLYVVDIWNSILYSITFTNTGGTISNVAHTQLSSYTGGGFPSNGITYDSVNRLIYTVTPDNENIQTFNLDNNTNTIITSATASSTAQFGPVADIKLRRPTCPVFYQTGNQLFFIDNTTIPKWNGPAARSSSSYTNAVIRVYNVSTGKMETVTGAAESSFVSTGYCTLGIDQTNGILYTYNIGNAAPGLRRYKIGTLQYSATTASGDPAFTSPANYINLKLWYDGADPLNTGTPPSNGTAVSTWSDKSGRGNNATGGTATYNAASGLVFAGSSTTKYNIATNAFSFLGGTQDTSLVSVYVAYRSNVGEAITLSSPINMSPSPTATGGTTAASFGGQNVNITSAPLTPSVASAINGLTNGYLYLNGTLGGTSGSTAGTTSAASGGLTSSSGNTSGGQSFIGNQNNNNYPMNGSISEILVYAAAHTDAERQIIEGYLAWKWGAQANLSSTHPYSASSPIRSTVTSTTPINSYRINHINSRQMQDIDTTIMGATLPLIQAGGFVYDAVKGSHTTIHDIFNEHARREVGVQSIKKKKPHGQMKGKTHKK